PISHSSTAMMSTYHSACTAKPSPPKRARIKTSANRATNTFRASVPPARCAPGASRKCPHKPHSKPSRSHAERARNAVFTRSRRVATSQETKRPGGPHVTEAERKADRVPRRPRGRGGSRADEALGGGGEGGRHPGADRTRRPQGADDESPGQGVHV